MRILTAAEMHCPKCVDRIKRALEAEEIKAEISLENKTVTVDDAVSERTIEILDYLGFTAV